MDMNILHTEEATLVELDRRIAPDFLQIMEKYVFTEDVRLLDGGEQLGRLTLMGPKSGLLLKKIMDAGVETLSEPFRHARRMIGKTTITVYRNDLAGELQFELIVPRDQLVSLWQILHEAGGHEGDNDLNMRAIGWSAFNTARVEAGTPFYGIDISDHYLPMETGPWYLRAVAVSKGCYLGQEIVARMHAHNAVAKLLVGLRVQGDKLPVGGTDIFEIKPAEIPPGTPPTTGPGAATVQQVGIITSSCLSPMLGNVPIAMGYVKKAFANPGATVDLLAEGTRVKAEIVPLPFWTRPA
jgi:folate-binding protein YgfZ